MDEGLPGKEASTPPKKTSTRRAANSIIDLNALYQAAEFQSREMPEEREARLRKEEKKADLERWKEKVIVSAVLVGLLMIGGSCLFLALKPGPSEDKKWAMSILASIVSAGVGYLGGRASKPD